jgi:hypothetical protein
MKRFSVLFTFFVLCMVIVAGTLSPRRAQAQSFSSPEARAKQLAIEAATPQLQITEEVLPLVIPGQTMGETLGFPRIQKATCLCTRALVPAVLRAAGRPRCCSSSTNT